MGDSKGTHRILVENPKGRGPLGRPGRGWEGNIKIDVREVGLGAWTRSIWFRTGTGGKL